MRPLWLEMKNIGPFVGKTRLELENIEEGGLFLISGPTGSGKTFIFDTICYALYGKTPSKREGHLKSDHGGIGDAPEIRFSFRVGDRTYLIERTLEYEDHKKVGGTTSRTEQASLFELITDPSSPDGTRSVSLASKKTEVLDRCTEILGLGMEQFSRVMMIPQGDFRELLRAETKDRESLLRKLFDSVFYLKVADELSTRYGRLSDEIKASVERNDTIIEGIVGDIALDTRPGEGLTFDEWSDEVIKKIEDDLSGSRIKEKVSRKSWDDSREQLQRSNEVYTTFRDLNSAKQKLKELEDEGKEKIAGYEKILDISSVASRLKPDLRSHDDLVEQKNGIEGEIISLTSNLEELERSHSEFREREEKKIPEMENEIREKEALKRDLESSLPLVSEITGIVSLLKDHRDTLKKREESRKELVMEKKGLDEGHAAIKEEVKGLSSREDISRLGIVIKNGSDLVKIRKRHRSTPGEIDRIIGSRSELDKRIKKEIEELSDLRKRREGSLAAELAKGLVEGKECPVCGSLDHPHPKGPSGEDVTLELIGSKELSIEKIRKELTRVNDEFRKFQTMKEELEQRSKDIISETGELSGIEEKDLENRITELKAKESQERKRSERKIQLEAELERISDRKDEIDPIIEQLSTDINKLEIEIASLGSKASERSDRMADMGMDIQKEDLEKEYEERIGTTGKRIDELNKILLEIKERSKKFHEDMIKINENLETDRKRMAGMDGTIIELVKKMEERISSIEGIDTMRDLRDAILEEDEESELKEAVQKFKDDRFRLQGTITDLEKKLIGYQMKVPEKEALDEMKDIVLKLEEAWRSHHKEMSQLEVTLTRTMSRIEDIRRTKEKMKEKEKLLSIVGRLTREVKGNSTPRISLERFFLAQRFEEVLISSNYRLKVLSGNRFLLRRAADEDRGARSRGGLDINVYDNYTGQERPANTLSGGQMFLSSLALALGLADVVQSRSGGIRMDTLLIDEGFGSLDEETLQTALKVLSELREGRMVGVISHVGELKRQIRSGFEVVPSTTGSTIKTI